MASTIPEPSLLQRAVIHPATYYAFRSALVMPQVAGVTPSLRTARKIGAAYGRARVNRTRIERAMGHIEQALPELDAPAREAMARRSYEHLFELAVEMTACQRLLTEDGWPHHIRLGERIKSVFDHLFSGRPLILITGHCGNWEVLGFTLGLLGFKVHGVYRPLDVKPLDRWVRESRSRRGLELVDKFGAVQRMPELIQSGAIGFVADQNAGDRGMFAPYFGRLTSTYKSIGLLALRTRAAVLVGSARRLPEVAVGGGVRQTRGLDYIMDAEEVIVPEEYEAQPDPLFYLTARYRRALERIVRRAPEQYLWMHRMWKSRPRHERTDQPFPPRMREKLAELPWMCDEDVERLVDRSDRDRAFLKEHNLSRLP